jgi:hypothetical protein
MYSPYPILNFMKYLFFLALPGAAENMMQLSENSGNMGLMGVWWDIQIKRNVFYVTNVTSIVLAFYNYKYCAIFTFLYGSFIFINTCRRWRHIVYIENI